jgi:hypothetical protein
MINQHKTLAIGKTGDVVHCHFNIADNDHADVQYLECNALYTYIAQVLQQWIVHVTHCTMQSAQPY